MGVKLLGASAALALLAAPPGAGAGPDAESLAKIQKERSATMKTINRNMLRVVVFLKKGDLSKVAGAARGLAGLIARIPELSPRGSDVGKTRIKPEVWRNFEDFKKRAGD